jgi:hypothetical protein
MAKLTIGRMAKLYGLHRSTLHEAVAKGRVTAGLDGKGQKVVDLSEMIRVYGEPPVVTRHFPTPDPDTSPTLQSDALHLLLEELRLLRIEVKELRESMLLLEHNPSPRPVSTAVVQEKSTTPSEPVTWANLLNALDE